jgi:HSP20 family protein
MKDNGKEIEMEFDLPGFDRKDIDIKLSGKALVIRASKKHEKHIEREDFVHRQKGARSFNYATSLPGVDSKKAKIDFKEGILKIKVPRVKKKIKV